MFNGAAEFIPHIENKSFVPPRSVKPWPIPRRKQTTHRTINDRTNGIESTPRRLVFFWIKFRNLTSYWVRRGEKRRLEDLDYVFWQWSGEKHRVNSRLNTQYLAGQVQSPFQCNAHSHFERQSARLDREFRCELTRKRVNSIIWILSFSLP